MKIQRLENLVIYVNVYLHAFKLLQKFTPTAPTAEAPFAGVSVNKLVCLQCRQILNFLSSIGLLAPAPVAHLPHDALTNLAYPSLPAKCV